MAETIIASYFENDGEPVSGLEPEIRIWEVTTSGNNLVIGAPQGTGNAGPVGGGTTVGFTGRNGVMQEIYDNAVDDSAGAGPAGSRDGFYRYVFDTVNGYDPTKGYIFRVDGGATLENGERYQVGELSVIDNASALVDLIYDEPATDHTDSNTMGELLNNTNATANSTNTIVSDIATNLTDLTLNVDNVLELLEIAVKYETNRTKIDGVNMTMTIFDSDGTTPLRVFSLLDGDGNPSITEVCERRPVSASDGLPVVP